MEVITAYSYKGGTGRTYTLVSLAAVLARFGKSVCILDLDLEAPGVLEKMRLLGVELDVRPGLIEFIGGYLGLDNSRALSIREIVSRPVFCDLPEPFEGSKRGTIHVIGAGDPSSEEYYNILSRRNFADFMAGEAVRGKKVGRFAEELKVRIESEIRPKPDYLLIDSRSGINELAGLCTRFMQPDILVMFTTEATDSVKGSRILLDSFKLARAASEAAPREVIVVLARVPAYYLSEDEQICYLGTAEKRDRVEQLRRQFISAEEDNTLEDPGFMLVRNEARVMNSEHLLIPMVGEAKRSNSTIDLETLISYLTKRSFPTLRGKLREIVPSPEEARNFPLDPERGIIVNPADGSWNVAFRRDTLLETFESLFNQIVLSEVAAGAGSEVALGKAQRALFEAGFAAADRFTRDLLHEWGERRPDRLFGVSERLQEWCKFDSSVGFGRFESRSSDSGESGEIRVINSFVLAEEVLREEGEAGELPRKNWSRLLPYLKGYVTRVLMGVLGLEEPSSLEVDERQETARVRGEQVPVSVFRYRIVRVAPSGRGKSK